MSSVVVMTGTLRRGSAGGYAQATGPAPSSIGQPSDLPTMNSRTLGGSAVAPRTPSCSGARYPNLSGPGTSERPAAISLESRKNLKRQAPRSPLATVSARTIIRSRRPGTETDPKREYRARPLSVAASTTMARTAGPASLAAMMRSSASASSTSPSHCPCSDLSSASFSSSAAGTGSGTPRAIRLGASTRGTACALMA